MQAETEKLVSADKLEPPAFINEFVTETQPSTQPSLMSTSDTFTPEIVPPVTDSTLNQTPDTQPLDLPKVEPNAKNFIAEKLFEEKKVAPVIVPYVANRVEKQPKSKLIWALPIAVAAILMLSGLGGIGVWLMLPKTMPVANVNVSLPTATSTQSVSPTPSISPIPVTSALPIITPIITPIVKPTPQTTDKPIDKPKPNITPIQNNTPVKTPTPSKTPKPKTDDCIYNGRCGE